MSSKITFVCSVKTSFVKKDIALLKAMGFEVLLIVSKPYKTPFLFLWNRLRELFLSILFVPFSKGVFCWFSDYHSFFPLLFARLMKKKSLVVVGGYDAVSDSALQYGIFLKKGLRRKIAIRNYKNASEIWAVHKSLIEGCEEAKTQNEIVSGILTFIPKLKTPLYEVPTGYNANFWKQSRPKKPRTVLTVANIPDDRTLHRKGIDFFLALASLLPDYEFTIVGGMGASKVFSGKSPRNVRILGSKSALELKDLYSESEFYFQGSRIEGLPNVLCEAMLCECIPIGNSVFGIPDAIGTTGFCFRGEEELQKVVDFIRSGKSKGAEARTRILKKYPESKRQKRINEWVIR